MLAGKFWQREIDAVDTDRWLPFGDDINRAVVDAHAARDGGAARLGLRDLSLGPLFFRYRAGCRCGLS